MSINKVVNTHFIPVVTTEKKSDNNNTDHLNSQQNLEPLNYLGDDHAKHDADNFLYTVGRDIHGKRQNDLLRIKQDQLMENVAADHASKYLSSGEVQSLASYVKNYGRVTSAADLLLNRLSNDSAQSVEAIINFLKAGKLSIAESYIILNYMHQKLLRKSSLKSLLRSLIVKLEQQESAFLFLFDFFALSKNPALKNHPDIIESVVRLNTGQINLESLRDTIHYIREKDLDVEQLVSGYIKYHLKIIQKLQASVSSFEERTMIAQFIGMEKKFIMVYSMFLKVREFLRQFFTQAGVLDNINYNSLLLSILNFAEAPEISKAAVTTLLKNFPAGSKEGKVGFLNQLIHLYNLFPGEIFASDKDRQSFFEGIRSYIVQNDPLQQRLLNHKPFDYFRNSKE